MKEIKEYREREHISQKEFANMVGVSQSMVSLWEEGKNIPRPYALKRISELTGVSIGELLNHLDTKVGSEK